MNDYQQEFIDFVIRANALRFGSFTLKSGRVSPYFFNSGLFNSGASIAALGRYYAAAIMHSGVAFDMLFGPAYKGIPLAVATSIALAEKYQRDVPYAFNRKEAKQHGEGGAIVGAALQGKVLIIDDVISAGTSVRESMTIIDAAQAQVAGVVISLDRCERGQGSISAIAEIETKYATRVISIVTINDVIAHLSMQPNMDQIVQDIYAYGRTYGY